MEIKRLNVWSCVKVFTIVYALLGLIFGAVVSLFSLSGFAPQGEEDAASEILSVMAVVFFPLLYGFIGAVGGMFTALFYNLTARVVGGIRVSVAWIDQAPAKTDS